MQIWDTAGQDRFKNIQASYYKGANGILVVYDITNRESFEHLNSWLIEIEKNGNKNVYKLLIGNKSDLEDQRNIKKEEGQEFAGINGMEFFETSAKTAYKVQEAFELLTKDIIRIVSKDKKPYALKKIISNKLKQISEFTKEFELVHLCNHENIMKIYSYCIRILDPTTYALYVLMELAECDWDKEIKKKIIAKKELFRKRINKYFISIIFCFIIYTRQLSYKSS